MKQKKNLQSKRKKASQKSTKKPLQNKVKPRKKRVEGKRKEYSADALASAIQSYRQGISMRKAANTHGVPRSTLDDAIKNPLRLRSGPAPVLSAKEEEDIVKWVLLSASKGYPIVKDQLLDSVQRYLNKLNKVTVFTDNRPGRHWYEAFLRRHPQVAERTAQNLVLDRANVGEEDLRKWFEEVGNYLKEANLLDIGPSRIFNCDESSIKLCPDPSKVLTAKGAKTVYKISNQDEKECLTTLFTYNAEGTRAPPMVLYKYGLGRSVPADIVKNSPAGWGAGNSESGWMTTETFYEYITNVFHPWLVQEGFEFPIVLYCDGHKSHLTYPLIEFCHEHQIELIALFPHSTHLMQPLDVGFFHPFKSIWKKLVHKWKLDNEVFRLKKQQFASVLELTLNSMDNEQSIMENSFRSCGLWPFDPDALDYNCLAKKKKPQSKSTTNLNLEQVGTMDSETASYLRAFEKTLPSELLKQFNDAELAGQWTGNIHMVGLYSYWLDVKNPKNGKSNVCIDVGANEDLSESFVGTGGELKNQLPSIDDQYFSPDKDSLSLGAVAAKPSGVDETVTYEEAMHLLEQLHRDNFDIIVCDNQSSSPILNQFDYGKPNASKKVHLDVEKENIICEFNLCGTDVINLDSYSQNEESEFLSSKNLFEENILDFKPDTPKRPAIKIRKIENVSFPQIKPKKSVTFKDTNFVDSSLKNVICEPSATATITKALPTFDAPDLLNSSKFKDMRFVDSSSLDNQAHRLHGSKVSATITKELPTFNAPNLFDSSKFHASATEKRVDQTLESISKTSDALVLDLSYDPKKFAQNIPGNSSPILNLSRNQNDVLLSEIAQTPMVVPNLPSNSENISESSSLGEETASTLPSAFDSSFLLPEKFLSSAKRIKLEKSKKPRIPSVGTSKAWMDLHEEKQKKEDEKKAKQDTKHQLREEKKALLEQKKGLDPELKRVREKIRGATTKQERESFTATKIAIVNQKKDLDCKMKD